MHDEAEDVKLLHYVLEYNADPGAQTKLVLYLLLSRELQVRIRFDACENFRLWKRLYITQLAPVMIRFYPPC